MKNCRFPLDNQTKVSTQTLYSTHRSGRKRERQKGTDRDKGRQHEETRNQIQTIRDVTRLEMLCWINSKAPNRNTSFTSAICVVRNGPKQKKWKRMYSTAGINAHSPITHTHSIYLKAHLHAENNCLSAQIFNKWSYQTVNRGDHRWATTNSCAARWAVTVYYRRYLEGEYMSHSIPTALSWLYGYVSTNGSSKVN